MNIKPKLSILNDKKDAYDKKDAQDKKDPERMDLMMRTIKAVHSAATSNTFKSDEALKKQRAEMEMFSKLVAPTFAVDIKSFTVENIACEWVSLGAGHRKDKIILYCHGGGYVSGGLGYARILAAKLAFYTGMETISFEYRLAPEHKYPSQIEDGMKLWNYLMHMGYGANDIILAGDSAGGNLALEMCLELRKVGRFLPYALVLMSPWTDMRAVAASYERYAAKDPLLTLNYVQSARNAYAGDNVDYELEQYSPVMADLRDFPPTLIQVGSNEILRGDSEHLAKNMVKAGSFARLEVYQGGWHVFQQMPLPKSVNAMENVGKFLNETLK